MSSGQRRIVFNTLERAISTDWTRAQAFTATARQQQLRRSKNRPTTGFDDYTNPGLYLDATALPDVGSHGTLHDVYGGLMVRPDLGAALLVDPGTAGFLFPAYPGLTTEDTPYIVVDDEGVQDTSKLEFSNNVTGSPRIDIVECQPVEVLVESASRDIYDPGTDSFAPKTVDKVRTAKLAYRIRNGTPGAGFPDLDPAWLPLAFVVVQSGASGFNQCDVYDVRPLVEERTNTYGGRYEPASGAMKMGPSGIWDRGIRPNAAQKCLGWFRGAFNGYFIGGVLRRNTPSSLAEFGGAGDAQDFDATNAANRASGANAPNNGNGMLNAIVAWFPKGLGRCVRYSQLAATSPHTGQVTPAGRLPQGPNGIVFLARPSLLGSSGVAILPTIPSIFGTVNENASAVVVGWMLGTGTGYRPFISTGKCHYPVFDLAPYSIAPTVTAMPATAVELKTTIGPTGAPIDWSANPAAIPCNAAKALVATVAVFTVDSVASPSRFDLYALSTLVPAISGTAVSYTTEAGVSVAPVTTALNELSDTQWVQLLPRDMPSSAGGPATNLARRVMRNAGSNQITAMAPQMFIFGWEDN